MTHRPSFRAEDLAAIVELTYNLMRDTQRELGSAPLRWEEISEDDRTEYEDRVFYAVSGATAKDIHDAFASENGEFSIMSSLYQKDLELFRSTAWNLGALFRCARFRNHTHDEKCTK